MVRRRRELIGTLAVVASNGFELLDIHIMASEVCLAAGDLVAASDHADALARLPFLRDEDHVALSQRLMVDALAGHFDDVVRGGERFRVGWERAGRPAAPDLARAAHAVAMVHGMLGDDERRAEWLRITVELGVAPEHTGRVCDRLGADVRRPPGASSGRPRAAMRPPQRRPRRPTGVGVLEHRAVAALVRGTVGRGSRACRSPRRGLTPRAQPSRSP